MKTLLAILALGTATAAFADAPPAGAGSPAGKPSAAVEEKEPWAWEMDLYVGYGQLAWPALDTATTTWSNGGPAAALSFAYRGPHFTHPFLDISYVPILASGQYVNVYQPGGGAQTVFASNSSYAIGLLIGPGWDIDWFRIRVGLGLYDVVVKTNVTGTPNTVTQLGLGYFVGLTALIWRPEPFGLGVEARLVGLEQPLTGIYQTMWSVGLSGRWDFARGK